MGYDISPLYMPVVAYLLSTWSASAQFTLSIFFIFYTVLKAWLYLWLFNLPAVSPPFNDIDVHYAVLAILASGLGSILVNVSLRSNPKKPLAPPLSRSHSGYVSTLAILFLVCVCVAMVGVYPSFVEPANYLAVFVVVSILYWITFWFTRKWVIQFIAFSNKHPLPGKKRRACSPSGFHDMYETYAFFWYVYLGLIVYFAGQASRHLTLLSASPELYSQYVSVGLLALYVLVIYMFIGQHLTLFPSMAAVEVNILEGQSDVTQAEPQTEETQPLLSENNGTEVDGGYMEGENGELNEIVIQDDGGGSGDGTMNAEGSDVQYDNIMSGESSLEGRNNHTRNVNGQRSVGQRSTGYPQGQYHSNK
jgi:hypothetical protein